MGDLIKKDELANTLQAVVDSVVAGDVDALSVMSDWKPYMEVFSNFEKIMRKHVEEEMEKIEEKTYKLKGVSFTKTSRSSYSFKHDPEWVRLDSEKKERERQMKAAMKDTIVSDDGEVVPPAQCSTSNSVTIKTI